MQRSFTLYEENFTTSTLEMKNRCDEPISDEQGDLVTKNKIEKKFLQRRFLQQAENKVSKSSITRQPVCLRFKINHRQVDKKLCLYYTSFVQ